MDNTPDLYRNSRYIPIFVLIFILNLTCPTPLFSFETVSLKTYPTRATKVSNPIDLTQLSRQGTYQVNDPHFILQFFFSGQNMLGVILKRDQRHPIKVRWCFFRDCEESPFDYNVVIAGAYHPPYVENYFEIKLLPQLQYNFQGLYFSSK